MTARDQTVLEFPPVKSRRVDADFGGGITGNGDIPLLAQVDRAMGLTRAVARALDDTRRRASCENSLVKLLQQRIYALAFGYADLNDHAELRHDLALKNNGGWGAVFEICRSRRKWLTLG